MFVLQSDLRSALQIAGIFCYLNPIHSDQRIPSRLSAPSIGAFSPSKTTALLRLRAFNGSANEPMVFKSNDKPSICTADELHYVSVPSSAWRLAVWRYIPPPQAPTRNHPLLLLSGVGTNATGYDLSPESSFARYMSKQGFDTWILEVRGAGLSTRADSSDIKELGIAISEQLSAVEERVETTNDESPEVLKLTETFTGLAERLSGHLSEGLSEERQNSAIASQMRYLRERLVKIIEESQRSLPQFFNLQGRLSTTLEDFQKQLDLIVKYDWDFDHYLEEDLPTVMEYIRAQSKPKDGKLLAIGHSMGGILLYAMLSRCGFAGRNSGLASVVTLASSLDYTSSNSSLKLLLPLADPAQALNVPAVPLGLLLAAIYPLASRPPYVLSWLSPQISAQDMMHPELFEKLVLNNFGTIPAKLLLQLRTAFREGGLCDRSGTFFYKEHLPKSNVPVFALAGDRDLICPPQAVYETVKIIPEHLVTYKLLGEPGGPHYAHYDLVGGRLAEDQVFPCIIEFLTCHDMSLTV